MTEVELPDGTVLEFPDGTAPDVMKAAAAKQWAKISGGTPGRADMAQRAQAARAGTLAQPSPERLAEVEAANAQAQPGRSVGQAVYDNLVGDPNDGVDSMGERAGRTVGDVARAGAAGVARGVAGLADLPGVAFNAMGNLATSGLERAGVVSPQTGGVMRQAFAGTPLGSGSTAREGSAIVSGGASEYRGQTTPGQYAGTVGEFLPGAAAFGGGTAANLLRFGVAPGLASEAAGQATEGTPYETAARVAGALAGSIAPGLVAKGVAKAISPNAGADPERLKLAAVLDDFGVPISAGQRVGSEALRRKEGLTGAGQALNETQREAFTAAALKTAGTDATRATPDVLAATAKRIGQVFDDVTRGVDVKPDQQAVAALTGAVDTYRALAPTGSRAPLVSAVLKDVAKAFQGGATIPAATVNTWRSNLSKLTASADAATRAAAQSALETVDDMLTASLTAAGRADDVARLATARGEWRNFLAIQRAASGAGESAAAGLLSPSALRNAVVQQGRAAFAQGRRGDLGDLARAGEGVMKQLPDSGTPAGIRAMLPGGSLSADIGAGIGSSLGGQGAVIGALAGAALPGIAGAARMSGIGQAYLANQLAPQITARIGTGTGTALLPFAAERNALLPR